MPKKVNNTAILTMIFFRYKIMDESKTIGNILYSIHGELMFEIEDEIDFWPKRIKRNKKEVRNRQLSCDDITRF